MSILILRAPFESTRSLLVGSGEFPRSLHLVIPFISNIRFHCGEGFALPWY